MQTTTRGLVLLACVTGASCLTPRPMMLMTGGFPVGKNVTDLAVGVGVGYINQQNPPTESRNAAGEPQRDQVVAKGFALPTMEANFQYGINRRISFNTHVAPGAVVPGAKFTLTSSRVVAFSILPQLGVGYGSVLNSTFSAGQDGKQVEVGQTLTTSFTFLAGLRLIFSHQSGIYVSAGYDFLFNRSLQSTPPTSTTDRVTLTTNSAQQNISFNAGLDVALRDSIVHLRPEFAFAIAPFSNSTQTEIGANKSQANLPGGLVWAILPTITIALQTPKSHAEEEREREEEEEEARKVEEAQQRQSESDVEEETPARKSSGDEGDEEEAPKARKKKNKADPDEEEEIEKPVRKKKKTVSDDE